MVSVYVPNGRPVGSEHYEHKLAWLDRLRRPSRPRPCDPDAPVVVCGDFNVAPEDRDVWDPTRPSTAAPTSAPPEREAVAALEAWGLDRRLPPVLARRRTGCTPGGTTGPATSTRAAACASTSCWPPSASPSGSTWALIDRNARKGKLPSDHAPLLVDFDLDGDPRG